VDNCRVYLGCCSTTGSLLLGALYSFVVIASGLKCPAKKGRLQLWSIGEGVAQGRHLQEEEEVVDEGRQVIVDQGVDHHLIDNDDLDPLVDVLVVDLVVVAGVDLEVVHHGYVNNLLCISFAFFAESVRRLVKTAR